MEILEAEWKSDLTRPDGRCFCRVGRGHEAVLAAVVAPPGDGPLHALLEAGGIEAVFLLGRSRSPSLARQMKPFCSQWSYLPRCASVSSAQSMSVCPSQAENSFQSASPKNSVFG